MEENDKTLAQEIGDILAEVLRTELSKLNIPTEFAVELKNAPRMPEIPPVDLSGVEKAIKDALAAFSKQKEITIPKQDFSKLEMILESVADRLSELEMPDNGDLIEAITTALSREPEEISFEPVTEAINELKTTLENKSFGGGIGPSKVYNTLLDKEKNTISPLDRDLQIDTSDAAALNNGENYTTGWIDRRGYTGIKVAFKTDQNGYYQVTYSPDQTNTDSTLTRYYRTAQIEPPHKFENMRRYVKVTFYNDSGSNQTYFRPDIALTNSAGMLNIPIDATMSQDYDAIATRPTDFNTEVALNRRQGFVLWNKFGYNQDIDTGTEVIASWGGTFTPLTTATTLTIVSTDAADDDGGTGCNSIFIYGIDANRDEQTELVTLNGTTNVVTTTTWLGINRVVMFLCGSGKVNAGTINITATTGGSTMAQMPAGGGVTQQCIFHVARNKQFIMEWLRVNTLKQAAQNPKVTLKVWVYSAVSNGKQEVYRVDIDTSLNNDISENPNLPFPITEQTVVWLEATTDKDNTIVNARFSGILINDVDA